ncbi:MAG: hypothetical protein Q4D16_09110 [Eubacteriales bacterium]|nr:hypothetical protein [Eubacteriales bacterium]
MWSTNEKMKERKMALADGGYMEHERRRQSGGRLSSVTAMIIGAIVTAEIMVAGAMLLNIDFHGADVIALVLVFMVLYFGVVAVLTDK